MSFTVHYSKGLWQYLKSHIWNKVNMWFLPTIHQMSCTNSLLKPFVYLHWKSSPGHEQVAGFQTMPLSNIINSCLLCSNFITGQCVMCSLTNPTPPGHNGSPRRFRLHDQMTKPNERFPPCHQFFTNHHQQMSVNKSNRWSINCVILWIHEPGSE